MTQSTKDGVTTTYTYNGDGLRMSKTTNGVTTSFILDGAEVIAEIKGNEITIYSRGLGLVSQTKGDTTKTYFSDSHGDITSLHSADADSEEALYDGFGNTLFNDSSDNPFGYCGEYYDEETGLIYLRARYYDPEIGRFISEDPVMDETNWYVYCSNNPVMFVDPSGMYFEFNSEDEYNLFMKHLYVMFGTTDLNITVDEYGDLISIEGGDPEQGSETAIALLSLMINSDEKFEIDFDQNYAGGGTIFKNIIIGTAENDGDGVISSGASDEIVQARIIHECMHGYVEWKGYAFGVNRSSSSSKINCGKLYNEAVAITVEEQFLKEMEYAPRNTEKIGGIGADRDSYGCWPWNISKAYGVEVFKESYGVSLMKSIYIWKDVQLEYYGR